jgi:hypothetical protein
MTSVPPKRDPEKKDDEPSFKDKIKETYTQLKDQDFSNAKEKLRETFSNFQNPGTSTTRDLVAYILLIIGVLLLFYYPGYGGTLVGVTVGLYFAHEIFDFLKNSKDRIEDLGIARSLILGGLFLAFLISAPFIFLGAAFAVALSQLLTHEDK